MNELSSYAHYTSQRIVQAMYVRVCALVSRSPVYVSHLDNMPQRSSCAGGQHKILPLPTFPSEIARSQEVICPFTPDLCTPGCARHLRSRKHMYSTYRLD